MEDKWILSKFNTLVRDVTDNLDKFELGLAVQKLYDFIWDILCDWYIELCKIRLNSDDEKSKSTAKAVLVYVMSNTLKLLHPFMPFITEEIWQTLPHDGDTIMLSPWCKYDEKLAFRSEEEQMESIMTAIKAVRNRRAEMNVAPSKKAEVFIETAKPEIFEAGTTFFKRLASASDVKIADSFDIDGTVSIVTADATIKLPLAELVDFEAERARLNKELAAAEKDLAFTNNKLNNQGFMSKAPEKVINEIKEKAAKYNEKIALLKESIAKLG